MTLLGLRRKARKAGIAMGRAGTYSEPVAGNPFFQTVRGDPDLNHARPVAARDLLPDALPFLREDEGVWLPLPPPPSVLDDLRDALRRLVLVMVVPKAVDILASDGVGNIVLLPAYRLRVFDVWPGIVDCPFELAALRPLGPSDTMFALRLVTPDTSLPAAADRPGRRGHPPAAADLVRAAADALARARIPWIALAGQVAGLLTREVLEDQRDAIRTRTFFDLLGAFAPHYRSLRAFAPRARSPQGVLREILRRPDVLCGGAAPFVEDFFGKTHVNLRDPAMAAWARKIVEDAVRLEATVRRARTRVRSGWTEVPRGFVTSIPRMARLLPGGRWEFLGGDGSLESVVRRGQAGIANGAAGPDAGGRPGSPGVDIVVNDVRHVLLRAAVPVWFVCSDVDGGPYDIIEASRSELIVPLLLPTWFMTEYWRPEPSEPEPAISAPSR
jgi:hypothetical protein